MQVDTIDESDADSEVYTVKIDRIEGVVDSTSVRADCADDSDV